MSPASREEIEAITTAVAKGIHDSTPPHRSELVDAQGHPNHPEQPVTTLNEKTAVSWPILAALVTMAVLAGGALVQAQDAGVVTKTNSTEIRALQTDSAINVEQHRQMMLTLQEIRDDVRTIKQAQAKKP